MERTEDSTLSYATPTPPGRGSALDYLAKTAILASVIQFLWFVPGVLVAAGMEPGRHGGLWGNTVVLGILILPALVSGVCGVLWLIRSARRAKRGLIVIVLLATLLAGGWVGWAGRFWMSWGAF